MAIHFFFSFPFLLLFLKHKSCIRIFLLLLLYGNLTRIGLIIYDMSCAFKLCPSEINSNERLGRMVTDLEGLLSLEPHDVLITWPLWDHMAFWKFMSLLSLNLAGYWLKGGASACKCLCYYKLLVPLIKKLRRMYMLLLQLFTSKWLWKKIFSKFIEIITPQQNNLESIQFWLMVGVYEVSKSWKEYFLILSDKKVLICN